MSTHAILSEIQELLESVRSHLAGSDTGCPPNSAVTHLDADSILEDFGRLVSSICWSRFKWENEQLLNHQQLSDLPKLWKEKREQDIRQAAHHTSEAAAHLGALRQLRQISDEGAGQLKKAFTVIEKIVGVERTLMSSFSQPTNTATPTIKAGNRWDYKLTHESIYKSLTYDRDLASCVYAMLQRLDRDLLKNPRIVAACGRSLSILLVEHEYDNVFQDYYELREYVQANDWNIDALIHLGQCESRLGNMQDAFAIAQRIWSFGKNASSCDLESIILSLFDRTSSQADSIELPGSGPDIAFISYEWNGINSETLLEAMIRRAFESDRWSDRLIESMLAAFVGYEDYYLELIPAHAILGFLGRLPATQIASDRVYYYEFAIDLAIQSSTREKNSDRLLLATQLKVAFLLFSRSYNFAIDCIAAASRRIRSIKNRTRIAKMLYGVELLRENFAEFPLASERHATLRELLNEYATELKELHSPEEDDVPDSPAMVMKSFRDKCEAILRTILGDRLWESLSGDTRRELVSAEEQFEIQSQYEGESGNFDYVPVALGKAVLSEAMICIRRKLPPSTVLSELWPMGEHNFGTLVKFLQRISNPEDSFSKTVSPHIARLRINVPEIETLKPYLEELHRLRNDGAHKSIDREQANVLRGSWFGDKKVLLRWMRALHPIG